MESWEERQKPLEHQMQERVDRETPQNIAAGMAPLKPGGQR